MHDGAIMDDDGLQTEELRLGAAEASLREELSMASGVGELLLSPSRAARPDPDDDDVDALSLNHHNENNKELQDTANTNNANILPENDQQLESTLLVSSIFCLLGVGTLLPWNAFISSEPYFHARLCSLFEQGSSSGSGSGSDSGGGGIELYFGLCFNVCGFLSLIVVIATAARRSRQHQIQDDGVSAMSNSTNGGSSANRGQILGALSLYLSLFVVTTVAVLMEHLNPTLFLIGTLSSLSVFGCCLAIAGTNIVGIAAIFPPRIAIAPFFAGQATGGAFISLTNFVSATAESPQPFWDEHCHVDNSTTPNEFIFDESFFMSSDNNDDDDECPPYHRDMPTFWFFFLGSTILLLCIVGFMVLDRLAITAHYRRLAAGEGDEGESSRRHRNDLTQPLLAEDANAVAEGINGGRLGRSDQTVSLRSVLNSIRSPALAIHVTAFVTLAIFPAFTSTIQSAAMCETKNRLQNDLFEPLGFVLFNFPDLLARILAPMFIDIHTIQRRPWVLFLSAAARLIFLPLFLFCNSSSSALPSIDSDLYSISVAICFAFSNGILMSLCFMVAPQLLPVNSSEQAQQRGSDFMNLALASGLLFGSCGSFLYNNLASTAEIF